MVSGSPMKRSLADIFHSVLNFLRLKEDESVKSTIISAISATTFMTSESKGITIRLKPKGESIIPKNRKTIGPEILYLSNLFEKKP